MRYRDIVIFMWLASRLEGQAGNASLTGQVSDPSGLAIKGAKITATDAQTGARFDVLSEGSGRFAMPALRASQYDLAVEAPGFRSYRRMGIRLRIGDRPELEIPLEVGPNEDTVTVSANAPMLQRSAGVGFNVDATRISQLPLDGRNFIPLVALSPGVALPNGSVLPRINGSRPRTNEYIYDGVSALQPEPGQVAFYPIIDAVEELRVDINSYSPEYGRSNGGAIVVNGRSGGNGLHGTVFDFFRNEALNARNYFATVGPKPEFRRNQYGFAVGGPIQHDKTFFFVDWQGSRLRTGVTRISTVPTLAQRQGIFSGATYDPGSNPRQQFAGNVIPASRFDAIGRQVLALYPLPTSPGNANNFTRTAVEPDDQDQFDVRVDRYLSSKHRLFARYSFLLDDDFPVSSLGASGGALTSGFISPTVTRGDQVVAEHSWTLLATAINQFRFGFTRRNSSATSANGTTLSIPGVPSSAFSPILPTFMVSGFQQIGPSSGANSQFETTVVQFTDTFSLIRGSHAFKFGTDIRQQSLDVLQPANPVGAYTFNTTGSNLQGVAASGNAVASLLLGQVASFSIDLQSRLLQPRANITEVFALDEWRVNNHLTMTYGTRYTLNCPSTEKNNQSAIFNLNTQRLDFPHTARELEYLNFGPRVGFAWQGRRDLVVRAGYGIVWFEQTGITTPFTQPQFPFVQTLGQQTQDNVNAAFTLSGGPSVQPTSVNANAGLGQGVFAVQRDNGSGYSQQWNFTLQKTIGTNWNVEAGYLGSKNTRLGLPEANLNQLPSEYLSQGASLLTRVPNPYFGQIPSSSTLGGPTLPRQQLLRAYPRFTNVALFRNNVGQSSYHAFQVKAEHRLAQGLTLSAAYTYSKLLDNASSYFSQTIFTGPILNASGAADAFHRNLEKDYSAGDIPHVFSIGWVYQIPRWWKMTGWQIGGFVRAQSGDRVAVSQATNLNASLGYAVQRPNRVADPNQIDKRTVTRFFNTGAFTQAPQFQIGTSSRNPVRGPGLQEADLMVAKTFAFRERYRFELRAEAFNVTNTPPLNDPNGSFGSAAFGSITSAGNPRVFEFVGKLHF